MKQTSLFLLLLLLPLSRGQRSDPGGGERSRCDLCDRHLSCNCSRRGFLAVPEVTGRALTLDLSFNDITTVTDDDLGGHAYLRVLSLHANRLAVIQDSAFSSLWSLESLDLSDNRLTTLNINWFSQLGVLHNLNLLNNPYRMKQTSLFLLLLLLPLSRGQRSDPGGGERSRCDLCDRHLSCNCSRRGFLAVPEVTGRALTLDLSFNDITTVTDDDLGGHAYLRVLSLHANRLAVIQDSAFSSLWSLESLDLSDNRLTTLNINWFSQLGVLHNLNLLNNPYRCLRGPSVFQGAGRLRRLALGGDALEEVRRGALGGVKQLDELTLHANNLRSYDPGSLGDIWPLGRVSLSLRGPFLRDLPLASSVLSDVSYPDTPLLLSDLQLWGKGSVQPFTQTTIKRVRSLALHNLSVTDAVVTDMLAVTDGAPLSTLIIDGVTLSGSGRWETANWTDHRGVDEVYIRNAVVLQIYSFVSFLELSFLLKYPRKISVIGSKVFVMPCVTSRLLASVQFADLTDNLLTDLTLRETLCDGDGTLRHLRVFNASGNALKSLSLLSRLVARLSKLTHLDVSRNGYSSMPAECSWPATLRYLNISRAKLRAVTPCLPATLEVLDLSYNDLHHFPLALPGLRELHLAGNKFLRLPPGWLFSNLELLDMQSNTLNMFGLVDLESYRRLQSLRLGHNKFVCSCEFVYFMQSEDIRRDAEGGTSFDTPALTPGGGRSGESGAVTLSDSEESYVCDSPLNLQGAVVSGVRLTAVECRRVLVVSAGCGSALVLAAVLGVLLWRLHVFWYVRMTWAWLRVKRNAACRRRRQRGGDGGDAEPLLLYDAFVSYSERDAAWVENFLVPELENPGGDDGEEDRVGSPPPRPFSLCLHKRDFLPGHWITDNIMAAMERSRRTIFVLSENFVRSEWCRYELDYSHFWLLDGSAKVGGGGCEEEAVLVLLEPLSKDDIPRRFCKLHKLMSSTTYLEWPQDQERRPHFWERLRDTLRGGEED